MTPTTSTTTSKEKMEEIVQGLVKASCLRSAQFQRLYSSGTSPSTAMKLADTTLEDLDVPRSVLPLLMESHELPSHTQKKKEKNDLAKAMTGFKFVPGPALGIPTIPKTVLEEICSSESAPRKYGKHLTREMKQALELESDDDLHPAPTMMALGGYYAKTLKMSDLQDWAQKLGNLDWRQPPTSHADYLLVVTYQSLSKLWSNDNTQNKTASLVTETAAYFRDLTQGELQKAAQECGLEMDSSAGKVELIVALTKSYYRDHLVQEEQEASSSS